MTIYLSDGSEVILNSGSRIEYLEYFSESERIVHLQGEAFFNVAKDSLKPFKVISQDIVTQAIGTSFNVRAYHDEGAPIVSLASGKVKVFYDSILQVQLNPGQSATLDPENKSFDVSPFDLQQILGWKDGSLIFHDDDQKTVFDKLSKWYGVNFKFLNNSGKHWNYNAEYKSLDLENVLGAIAFAMDFKYQINKDKVEIVFNN
jgi:ferric-dicitrate binding protein FerR (iron transport regulator)